MPKVMLQIESSAPAMYSKECLVGFLNAKGEMCYLFIDKQHFVDDTHIHVLLLSSRDGQALVQFPTENADQYLVPMEKVAIPRAEDKTGRKYFCDEDDAYIPEAIQLGNLIHQELTGIFERGEKWGLRTRDIGSLVHAVVEELVCERILNRRAEEARKARESLTSSAGSKS